MEQEVFCEVKSVTKDSDGALIASRNDEDVWAYNDQNEKWRSLGELPTAALDELTPSMNKLDFLQIVTDFVTFFAKKQTPHYLWPPCK